VIGAVAFAEFQRTVAAPQPGRGWGTTRIPFLTIEVLRGSIRRAEGLRSHGCVIGQVCAKRSRVVADFRTALPALAAASDDFCSFTIMPVYGNNSVAALAEAVGSTWRACSYKRVCVGFSAKVCVFVAFLSRRPLCGTAPPHALQVRRVRLSPYNAR
jgi:hypothetical protein